MSIKFLLATVFLLLPLGSDEDRMLLVAVWGLLQIQAVTIYLKRLQDKFSPETLRCVALSLVCIVWAWANARIRTGDGPLHISTAGVWRGYPLAHEAWILAFNPQPVVWHEFHPRGMAVDLALLVVAWLWIRRRFPPFQFHPLPACMAMLSGVYVWLNIEEWVQGAPLTLIDYQPRPFPTVTMGFPWVYRTNDPPLHPWPLIANVMVGCVVWAILFAASKWTSHELREVKLDQGIRCTTSH